MQYDGTPRGLFPRVVANYEGVELDVVKANPWEGTSDEFKSKFPMNKVPAFEAGEFKLSECIAISAYIAKSNGDKANLLASKGSVEEQAAVLQWCSWANAHLLMSLGQWFSPLLGRVPYNKNAVEGAKTQFNGIADYLEKSLVKQTFLAGERISLADIYVAAVIGRGLEFVLEPSWRQAHPAIMRHFLTVTNQEAFKKTGVSYKLCDKAIVYTPPKKEEKPKAAAAPKEKAAPAPAPAAEEDKPAPKPKHPCEALGPATCFPIDEFKRQYSNLDTPDAMKWLEQNVNTQEYSFAKVMYKYNDELTQGAFCATSLSLSRTDTASLLANRSVHVVEPDRWLPRTPRGLAQVPLRLDGRLRRLEQLQDCRRVHVPRPGLQGHLRGRA